MRQNLTLFDFPDYTAGNPWQVQTLGVTDGRLTVSRQTTWPPPDEIDILHIGWEDIFLHQAKSELHALQIAEVVANQIHEIVQRGTKLIWTIHNLRSHTIKFEHAENMIRAALLRVASAIVVMSEKHVGIIPTEFQAKIRIIPHYILDLKRSEQIISPKEKRLTLFRYGAPRNETNIRAYQSLIKSQLINKLVSDSRLQHEIDDDQNLMVKRRFSRIEELLYGARSSFSFFSRQPCLNSGVFNFYLGARNPIFHSRESVEYLDMPSNFTAFELEKFSSIEEIIDATLTYREKNDEELDYFLEVRDPKTIQSRWQEEVIKQL